jgi:hypothetical protein
MSAPTLTLGRGETLRTPLVRWASLVLGSALGALALGWLLLRPQELRPLLAAAAAFALFCIGLADPRKTLYLLVIWLASLGFLRRVISEVAPRGQLDFLVLVAPAIIASLLLAANRRGAFARRTYLANTVLLFSLLVLVSALNPLQGSPLVGITGLLFLLVPMLAFWIGRSLCDDRTLTVVLVLVAVLALPAAAYGLAQTFIGFPSWDADWIRQYGYEAIFVYRHPRAFASFSASSEYAMFVAIAIVVWIAFGLRLRLVPLTLAALSLLAIALFYESSRGVIFATALAVVLMASARRRLPIPFAVVASGIALVAVPFLAGRLSSTRTTPPNYGSTGVSVLFTHQTQGLANPFNPAVSTLPTHLNQFKEGLRSAVSDPLGHGAGAITNAAGKFGAPSRGTETDPSNAAVALGVPGLLVYLFLLILAFRRSYGLAAARRDSLALAVLGLLTVTLFQWLNGGQYAVAFLPWLALGWMDRTLGEANGRAKRGQESEDEREADRMGEVEPMSIDEQIHNLVREVRGSIKG